MSDCIFCKIVKGELPMYKIYEDGATLAFLDIQPVNPGHTLVVAKRHSRNIFDVPTDDWSAVTNCVDGGLLKDADLSGYRIRYGTNQSNLGSSVFTTNLTYTATGLSTTTYFSLFAVGTNLVASDSAALQKVWSPLVPGPVRGVRVLGQ